MNQDRKVTEEEPIPEEEKQNGGESGKNNQERPKRQLKTKSNYRSKYGYIEKEKNVNETPVKKPRARQPLLELTRNERYGPTLRLL